MEEYDVAAPPEWAQDTVEKHQGSDLRCVMSKTLEQSDLDRNQNRFLLRRKAVRANLITALTQREKEEANLMNVGSKRKRMALLSARVERLEEGYKKVAGRSHGGVDASVYIRNGWRMELKLTQWDGSGSNVLKDREWRLLCSLAGFRRGDFVRLLFRRQVAEREVERQTNKLCFALG
ncbi:hypothetical protein IEQ34_011677 [Dendrobium chrysotoxum]|uniref:B3 domain-containing protein n=1 Tax=Dendrobium chrysotoxum TaxID=161865 RepID=A0AAV7GT48_DENCH|nr:hypothetical protein IEQ34_011677 [Dendrobium chrysotoxum]